MARTHRPNLMERAIAFLQKRRKVKIVELMMYLGCSGSTIYRIVAMLKAWGCTIEGDGSNIFEKYIVYPEEE